MEAAFGEEGKEGSEPREEKAKEEEASARRHLRGRDLASNPVYGVNTQTPLCLSLFSWATPEEEVRAGGGVTGRTSESSTHIEMAAKVGSCFFQQYALHMAPCGLHRGALVRAHSA